MADPARDVRSFLSTQVAGLTEGTNLFPGQVRERDVPADCTFVVLLGGPAPIRSSGETSELRTALVNVFVRNQAWGAGNDLAQLILDAFNGLAGKPAGYEVADVRQSSAGDIGRDDKGRFLFSVTVRLRWNQAT